MAILECAILLQDALGEKTDKSVFGKIKSVAGLYKQGAITQENILRGELIVSIPGDEITPRDDGQKPHNFRVIRDHTTTLFCEGTEYAPLNDYEFHLLEGIASNNIRYDVFCAEGKLDWGSHLKKGSKVYVSLLGHTPVPTQYVSAVVHHVGRVETLPGITFGVEITDKKYRGCGYSQGTFQNISYFQCENDCGLFVALDRLSATPEGPAITKAPPLPPKSGGGKIPTDPTIPRSGVAHLSAGKTGGRSSSVDPVLTSERFKLGDRVVIFDKKSVPVHGAVRWVGRRTPTGDKPLKYTVLGIETDVSVNAKDFEYAHADMSHLIKAKKNRSLFIPEGLVMSEEQHTKDKQKSAPGLKYQWGTDHDAERVAAVAAGELGMGKTQLLVEHKEAMKQIEDEKTLAEARKVLPGESIDIEEMQRQQEAFQEFEKQKAEKAKEKSSTWQSGGQGMPPTTDSQPLGPLSAGGPGFPPRRGSSPHLSTLDPTQSSGSAGFRKQHSYEPVPLPGGHLPHSSNFHPSPEHPLMEDQQQGNTVPPGGPRYNHLGSRGFQGQQQQPWSQPSQPAAQLMPPAANHPPPHQVQPQQVQPSAFISQSSEWPDLAVGSAVQLADQARYGVIRWIGQLQGVHGGVVAGVELDDPMRGCTDGTWQQTGEKYFHCPPGRGIYYPLSGLKPDQRFATPATAAKSSAPPKNPLDYVPWEELLDQYIEPGQVNKYLGEGRGIQGHQNSCYLDATVFGLFAVSDAFDSMFLEEAKDDAGQQISSMLWRGIVNPLRKNGVVRHESVMSLRNKLEEFGKMKGITQDEKDPEEFLNMLFKYTLNVKPFISISRPFGVEKEYFVQLFLEPDETIVQPPTVGFLLKKMFKEQNIRFTRVPSKLLIQVPRYGKQFKMYKKIVPELVLNVADLTGTIGNSCRICLTAPASLACSACKDAEFNSKGEDKIYFCEDCSNVMHKNRPDHKPEPYGNPELELELLCVICIETSHYVCFARSEERWIFFDSMANRVYDMYNIPQGVDCTWELNEWVYCKNLQWLVNTPPRELPEYVRRFTQDIYMCIYIQPDVGMYGDADAD